MREASDIASPSVRISVVIVTYNSSDALKGSLPALRNELREGDEVVVVDNASEDGSAELAAELLPDARVVRHGSNAGFATGCNLGAQVAEGDLLIFLNPDATPAPGFRDAIERPVAERPGWGAWMGLVTMDGGAAVNTSGGVLHFTGVGWAGQAGQPVADVRADLAEVAFVSGACLAIPRSAYLELGGFSDEYFMYCEDVDLSLRVRLRGRALGVVPAARVEHSYEFEKGALKWRLLERNRVATLLRTYPAALLALIAPALAATELAILAAALRGGWGREKLLAWSDVVRSLPRLLHERRVIQAQRQVGARDFARALSAELTSPYLGAAARARPLGALMSAYWHVVLTLLGAPSGLRDREQSHG